MIIRKFIFTLLFFLFLSQISFAATYEIDPVHSNLGFAVKHLMVSTVRGSFTNFSGEIRFDPKDTKVFETDVVIQTQSIDTRNLKRDDHLRSSDFLDAAGYPTINFKGKKLSGKKGGYTIIGDLTIRGVSKEISIPVEISGPVESPFGTQVIGISGETAINRQDFGVSWNKVMDQGGLVVDNNVKLVIDIEAKKK